jgi:hypothetical protein
MAIAAIHGSFYLSALGLAGKLSETAGFRGKAAWRTSEVAGKMCGVSKISDTPQKVFEYGYMYFGYTRKLGKEGSRSHIEATHIP